MHIPKHGYVGVGVTTGEALSLSEAEVESDGQRVLLRQQPLAADYEHSDQKPSLDADLAEYVVPVRWETTVPKSEAYWVKGMFANQNSAGKLRQEFTLERLLNHFGIEDE